MPPLSSPMRLHVHAGVVAAVVAAGVLAGCSAADSRVIKRWDAARTAKAEFDETGRPMPPPILPVVFIPGSKGSVLKQGNCQDGKTIWGSTRSVWLSALDDLLIPLPASETWDPRRFEQGVYSCDIVDAFDVRLFLPFQAIVEYPIYRDLMEILKDAGGFDRKRGNIFYFHYDWRLDTRVAAVELAVRLPEYRRQYHDAYLKGYCAELKLTLVPCLARLERKWPDLFAPDGIKFNIVAHSLGGLVAGYLARGLGRGPEIEQLILIAAPSEGALFPMRVAVEGEHAFGDLLIHYYDKKETRPIGISFPSLFQALPRYRDALKQPDGKRPAEQDRRDLALVDDLSLHPDRSALWAQAAAERWLRVVEFDEEGWALICKRSHAKEAGDCRKRMTWHLKSELRSSVGFQQTLTRGFCRSNRDDATSAAERQEFENQRVAEAWSLLAVVRPDAVKDRSPVVPAPCPTDPDPRTREEKRVARENPAALHQFFGHCDPTPTSALVVRDGTRLLDFCEARDPEENPCLGFGDGRIPRTSMQALSRHHRERRPSEITVCAGHVDIVKNPTVQDNLLRLLLGDRVQLTPAKQAR